MGKGTNQTTNSTTSAPAPQAAAAYNQLLNQAGNVASTPYQAYTGELTAPVNAQQTAGISGINQNANFAQPAVNQAIGIAGNAANPLTAQQIQQYQNPYTQDVVNATQAQFNNQNAQQQAGVTGNAISQGALGGNRVGVAQSNLANQQQLAQAPVIAGLYNQSYNTGLATAENQFQQNPLAAAGSLANFGISGQNAALSGAGAQLGAGTLQQQTQQAQDAAAYQQYAQAQAYPFQTTQWLAGLDTGVGSQLGGTSSGQTTGPAPNQTAQYAGLGLAAAGLFLNRGGRVERANGGVVPQHMDSGGVSGTPWSQGVGWVPSMNIHAGSGAPHASAPGVAAQPAFDASKFASGITGLKGGLAGPAYGGGNIFTDSYGGSSSNPLPGLDASDYGAGFKRGGVVGYADGGAPDFSDRFDPAVEQPFGDMPRGEALGLAGLGGTGIIPQPATRSLVGATYDDGQGPVPMYGQRPTGNAAALKGTGVAPSDDGDVETPEDATPTSGRGTPSAGVSGVAPAAAGFTPPYQITPADYAPPARDTGSGIGFGLISPNAKSGLLSAGLGMLASRSPFLGTAIGEGGLTGLSAYGSAEEKDRKAAEDAQKLSLEAKQAANAQALSTYNVNHKGDMTDYQQAMINQGKFSPIGSIVTPEGGTHPLILDQKTAKIIDAATGEAPSKEAKYVGKADKGPQMPDEDAKAIATRYIKTGDRTQLQGLGVSGQARQKVNHYIGEVQKEQNISDEELGQRVAEFEGRKAGQRTLGTQEARMGSAAFEVEGAINLARGVVERVPRTSILPLNKLIAKYQEGKLDPDQIELMQRLQAIKNTYAAVMARGSNVTTDAARSRGDELLSDAYDAKSMNRVFDTMQSEIDMAKNSPERMRQFYRQKYGANAAAPEDATSASPAGGTSGGFTPPPGAIPQTHAGKIYYYDPQTKQPYPGQ